MEAARVMLHDQDLPMHLWAEAARTMVYVQNCTPHRVLENNTPEELFFGRKPEVNHLRIFSCPVYVHILKEKRSKRDPLGKKGIFVGYSENSKLTEYTSQGSKILTSVGMYHLMKIQPTSNLGRDRMKNLKKQEHP